MALEILVGIAVASLVVLLIRSDFVRWLYRKLRCIYYLRQLPLNLQPDWLVGHSNFAHPERVADTILRVQMDPERPGKLGVARSDLATLMYLANLESPDSVATLLRSSEPKNSYIYSFLEPWIGEGLLIANGKKWARNRRLLTPAFHFDVLKGYATVYNSAMGILLEKWRTTLQDSVEGTASGSHSARVNVSRDVTLLTLDVILRCAMSHQSECQTQPSEYTNAVMSLIVLSNLRALNVLHHSDFIYYRTENGRTFAGACRTAHQYADDIIQERRDRLAEQEGDGERVTDFLDILLTVKDTDGKGLSHRDVRNEVDTFLFEGHDTTASALQWTLYFLAGHPEVQERCRAEAQEVLGASQQSGHGVTYDCLQKMDYIGQALKEAMRLATTVPFIYRCLTQDTYVGGFFIPQDAWVSISLYGVHHNPTVWPDPMKYDPSRFDPGKSDSRPPFAYAPFSGGPRNCIGQNLALEEMKSAVSLILLEYRLTVPDDMREVKQWLIQ